MSGCSCFFSRRRSSKQLEKLLHPSLTSLQLVRFFCFVGFSECMTYMNCMVEAAASLEANVSPSNQILTNSQQTPPLICVKQPKPSHLYNSMCMVTPMPKQVHSSLGPKMAY